MSLISRTYTFTDGTVAYGSQVNSEIANIVNTLNSLDQGNITWSHVRATNFDVTNDIDMAGNGITNLASPTTAGDAARYPITSAQIQDATITGTDIAATTITASNIVSGTITTTEISNTAGITGAQLASSVALAGSPTTTTQSAGDNSTKIATTAYADTATKYVLIGSQDASNSSAIGFTGFSGASYSSLEIYLDHIVPGTNGTDLSMTVSTGSGFLTANYRFENTRCTLSAVAADGSTSAAAWALNGNIEHLGTGANQIWSGHVTLYDVSYTGATKRVNFRGSGLMSSGSYVSNHGGGEVDTQSSVIDGVRFVMSSGNIASGTIRVYGIKNS